MLTSLIWLTMLSDLAVGFQMSVDSVYNLVLKEM